MKRPPVTIATREFVEENWAKAEKAHRRSLRQNPLGQLLGWMLIALTMWGFGAVHGLEPRLLVFFIFPIPAILVLRGSAGGLRFSTVALFFSTLFWFMWLRPALAGTHPVAIQGHWSLKGARGFMSLGVLPLIHLASCLAMAVVCLVTSRIKFATKPVIAFLIVVSLVVGIPLRVDADRAARVRRDFTAELAATKAFIVEKRYQDGPGAYSIGSKHPQAAEIAPVLEGNPRIRHVYTFKSMVSGAVFIYDNREAKGTHYYNYDEWIRMPSGEWLKLDMGVNLNPAP